MGKKGPVPKIIDTTWTPELAYVVGIFASDGNLGKDGMYLEVTSNDRIVLKNVLHILHMEHIKIGTKNNGSGRRSYRIQFKRVRFHAWLLSLGLTPNKSKTISKLKIPEKLFFDFLRGEWDGDGTIYSFKDTRWKNSFTVSLGFASGSKDFLLWIKKELTDKLKTTGHIVSSGQGTHQLRYARNDSKKIFDAMYYKAGLPHLPRKFTKAKKIFTITGL